MIRKYERSITRNEKGNSGELSFAKTSATVTRGREKLAHVRHIKILTWLRGFLVFFLYLVWFSLCSSLFWELGNNRVLNNLQFWPSSLGVMLELSNVGHWPIADRRVPSNDPTNNYRTHFGSCFPLVSIVANGSKCLQWSKTGNIKSDFITYNGENR